MNLRIAGKGWVTPLGRGIDLVWDRLIRGDEALAQPISDSVSDKTYSAFRVPPDALKNLLPHPRLRRASAISRFAAAAGLDALDGARSTIGEIDVQRLALVFAVSNGESSTTSVFTTMWSSPAHNRRGLCFFLKRVSMGQAVMLLPFSGLR